MRKTLMVFLFALCFVDGYSQYKHEWTKTIGDSNTNYGPYSTIDSSGNTILFFESFYDYDIDPDTSSTVLIGTLNLPNCFDHVLAKYDSAGNYLWHRLASLYNTSVFFNVNTDAAGNIFYSGYFSHTAIIQDGLGGNDTIISSNNGNDVNGLIIKYSPAGVLLFARKIESSGVALNTSTIDANGNIFIYGIAYGSYIDFDMGPGLDVVNSFFLICFYVKYDNSGQLVFYKVFTPPSLSSLDIIDLKIDNSGNIVTTGWVDGTADLGGGNVGTGQYFAKYDSAGNYIFHKLITGDLNFINSIVIDKQNNIILSGFIRTTAIDIDPDLGVYIIQPNGTNEALLAKYDSSGNFIWGHGFGSASSDQCGHVEIDSSGSIYVAAGFGGTLISNPTFGLGSANSGNALIKFDANGYVISYNALTNRGAGQLSLFNNNALFIQGGFYFGADFDFSTGLSLFNSNGSSDIYLSKYLLKNEHFLISGKVYSDINNDSIYNAGDVPLQNVIVNVNPGNYFASTNAAGDYYCYVPQGNYTITIPTPPVHYTVSFPFSDTAVFMPLTSQIDTSNHFALHPEPNAQDLKISMTNLGPLRPGFVGAYVTSAANVGTVALSATATFDYDSDLIYYSAAPVADTILPYHLAWNVDTLFPSQSTNLLSEFIVAANLGDTVTTECRIYPDSADLTPTNNKDKLNLIAQGSWDPNYKEVFPQGALLSSQADTTLLTYTIHFQNTGTDTAFTVILVDTLSDLLNVSTFVLEAMSHACTYVISGNGIIEFTFRNIFLPDSGTNFIGSCGFVKYSIKPHVGLTNGMTIENTAHIVFDFNVPVITNTTQTPIGVLGVDENNSLHNSFFLFPNPTSSFITLSNFKPAHSYSISIKNILGNTIISQTTKGKERASINVEQLPSGIYFVMAESDGKVETKKFVKQ